MTENPFRAALAIKESAGGWSVPGLTTDAQGRGCLIANLSRAFGGDVIECDLFDGAFDLLAEICQAQTGYSDSEGAIVDAHNRLPGEDLDRIMEKAAVAWDERI